MQVKQKFNKYILNDDVYKLKNTCIFAEHKKIRG